jgi:ribosomal protein S1
MIEVGSIVEGTVERVELYGIYLKHGDETVIVLAPEVSWQGGDIREKVAVGDKVQAKILRLNYKTGEHVGSIRRLQQDRNPYRRLSRLPRGTVLRGRVAGVYADDITVRFSDEVWGHLPKSTRELKTGEEVAVSITFLDVEEGILNFQLAQQDALKGNVQPRPAWPNSQEIVLERRDTA